jgi:alpha-glucosidase
VNGAAMAKAGVTGEGGWRFEGITLTTVIPVAAGGVDQKVTIEVRRADGLTARRSELDGFAGAMVRLRGAYDAVNVMSRMLATPDPIVDAMQSGDRLSYHPEKAAEELAHFHATIPQAQNAIATVDKELRQRIDEAMKWVADETRNMGSDIPFNADAQKQRLLDALARAQKLAAEAGK